jgi:hypothetical protein
MYWILTDPYLFHKTRVQYLCRLRWCLDKQGKLDPAQSGFPARHSIIDNLVQLEIKVLKGMANKCIGAVVIDISKAFDLV